MEGEQGELALLDIKLLEGLHHRLHRLQLVIRSTTIQCAVFDPLRVALLAQRELTLGFGNLFSTST